MKLNGIGNENLWLFGKKCYSSITFRGFWGKKLHFEKSFLWVAWGTSNHAQLMRSVFWTCCKNLFFVMEFLKIFYVNFDTYFFIFSPKISNINLNMPSKFLALIFFTLILLFHLILRNYIVTQRSWKVLHNLIFMIWFH